MTATINAAAAAVASRMPAVESETLLFGQGNGKLDKAIDHFSIPAGWSCPGASECLARAVEKGEGDDGRMTWGVEDGPDVVFRCFSASEEARYPQLRTIRWHNWRLLKAARTVDAMTDLILRSIPKHPRVFQLAIDGAAYSNIIRGHIGGDFYNQNYFDAWLAVCCERPDVLFYAYTKSLPFWVRRLDRMPSNFVLTASEGGKHDALIAEHGLRFARVVYTEAEAAAAGLPIDHDDSHAMRRGGSFALIIHGPQPKGTPAAKALQARRDGGDFGYGKKAAKIRKGTRVELPMA